MYIVTKATPTKSIPRIQLSIAIVTVTLFSAVRKTERCPHIYLYTLKNYIQFYSSQYGAYYWYIDVYTLKYQQVCWWDLNSKQFTCSQEGHQGTVFFFLLHTVCLTYYSCRIWNWPILAIVWYLSIVLIIVSFIFFIRACVDAILSVACSPVEARKDRFVTTGVDGCVKFWTCGEAGGNSGDGMDCCTDMQENQDLEGSSGSGMMI